MSWNELRLRAGVQGQLQQIPAVQPEDGPAVGADVPDGLQLGGQQVRRLQRGEKDSIKVFFAYREVLLTSLYDKKPDGQDRTAAEKNYAAKAACRRRRILQSKILCNCSVDLRTCCADRKIT